MPKNRPAGRARAPKPQAHKHPPKQIPSPPDEAPETPVDLKIMSWQQVQEEVAAHRGKIVVLDAWSTSCQPCIKEFPNLVDLNKKYQGGEVVCMSLSVDYAGIKKKPPEFYRERVEEFLAKQHADFQNFLLNQDPDQWYNSIELAAIPAVFVYGPDGNLVQRFDNDAIGLDDEGFTYKDVNSLIEKLLALQKAE